jgi:hypothetical protein
VEEEVSNRTKWDRGLVLLVGLVVIAVSSVIIIHLKDVQSELQAEPPIVEPESHGDDTYTFATPLGQRQLERSLEAFHDQHPELECVPVGTYAYRHVLRCTDSAINAQDVTVP